jgi:heat shock protein HslJ
MLRACSPVIPVIVGLYPPKEAVLTFSISFNKFVNQLWVMDARPALIAFFLATCVFFAGCTSISSVLSPQQNELKGPSWRLVSYSNGERTLVPVGPGTNITLKFGERGNLTGSLDGCRRYSGHYTTLGETIKITNLTEVDADMCPWNPQTADMNTLYFTLLQKSPRFNINENILIFGYYDAERYLVFSRA